MKTVETFDIGDTVLCDLCNADYTNSEAKGGFLFGSKGVCPDCAPRFEAKAKEYGEADFIKARALPDETFKAFVLRIRGGNNTVTVSTFDTLDDMLKSAEGD
jgi:hypothetical protein